MWATFFFQFNLPPWLFFNTRVLFQVYFILKFIAIDFLHIFSLGVKIWQVLKANATWYNFNELEGP